MSNNPKGLPQPAQAVAAESSREAWRFCSKCGAEARIVSNSNGRFGHCGPCKFRWSISLARPGQFEHAALPAREFTKQTIVPQYSEESLANAPSRRGNDTVGPKHLRKRN